MHIVVLQSQRMRWSLVHIVLQFLSFR
jgi:hypothetical protein